MQTAITRPLRVLEMVAPLVLHAKSIDIDKALFCFSESLISFQNLANQKLLNIKLRLKVHLYIIIFIEYRKLLIIRPPAPPPLAPIKTCKRKNHPIMITSTPAPPPPPLACIDINSTFCDDQI